MVYASSIAPKQSATPPSASFLSNRLHIIIPWTGKINSTPVTCSILARFYALVLIFEQHTRNLCPTHPSKKILEILIFEDFICGKWKKKLIQFLSKTCLPSLTFVDSSYSLNILIIISCDYNLSCFEQPIIIDNS